MEVLFVLNKVREFYMLTCSRGEKPFGCQELCSAEKKANNKASRVSYTLGDLPKTIIPD